MAGTNGDASGSQIPDEQQAPPYVLHPHGPPVDEIESLPIYTEQHDPNAPITIRELKNILETLNRAKENDVNSWRRYLAGLGGKQTDDEREFAERVTIKHYFGAIAADQEDVIALLFENHLVTANTKMLGMTPLLMAVQKKNVAVVQQLMELGAEPNEFGNPVSYGKPFLWIVLTRSRN
jgi:hypothetical protein